MPEKDKAVEAYPGAAKLKAINRTRVYEEIIGQIQQLIDEGKLRTGDQLPPERELAKIFRVSRYSVREAIQALQDQGVLKSRLGSGTYVISGKEPSVAELLAAAIENEKGKIKDIFEFRFLIEPAIAYLAGKNASAKDIESLEALLEQQKQAGDVSRMNELGERFHLALAEATNNAVFYNVALRINDILSKTRTEIAQDNETMDEFIRGHREILKAVKAHDAESARQKMTEHLRSTQGIVSR